MTWMRIAFEDAITHCVHSSLAGSLIAEMIERKHQIKNFEETYGLDGARHLGGNPKIVREWSFDVGGPCFVDAPFSTFTIDGLLIEVTCSQIEAIRDKLLSLVMRRFDDGRDYYKAKFWIHALVMTPSHYATLVSEINAGISDANRRADEFVAAVKRGQLRGVS